MTKDTACAPEHAARKLARELGAHEMPLHTAHHAALAEARIQQDAKLVSRVAALAGVPVETLAQLQDEACAHAGAAMEKIPAEA